MNTSFCRLSRSASGAIDKNMLLGGGIVLLVAALAIPKLFSGSEEVKPVSTEPLVLIRTEPKKAKPKPHEQAAPASVIVPPKPRAGVVIYPVREDGDLVLEVSFRWSDFAHGAPVPATVRFGNTGPKEFHLPAAGEPHPTLTVVVLDAEGREVRRVVETSVDPYARRTRVLTPGGAMDVDVRVVDTEDAPLPPGAYTVFAEFRPDPAWVRLGLPFWTGPNGTVRSAQEGFTVLAKTE